MRLDVNCDLGEGETAGRTRALMRWITSANVASGGHAGNVATMERCVELAKRFGIRLGAHPGPWGRRDFGRGPVRMDPDELELLLLQQVGALERVARAHRMPLHHIKLHGSLYHASEQDAGLALRYARVVARFWPRAIVYARAGGRVGAVSRRAGLAVWEEAFADRGYRDDGTLVPRGGPGAVLDDVRLVVQRVRDLMGHGTVISVSGRPIRLQPRTVCIHSDTPHAVRLARAVAAVISHDGWTRGGRAAGGVEGEG